MESPYSDGPYDAFDQKLSVGDKIAFIVKKERLKRGVIVEITEAPSNVVYRDGTVKKTWYLHVKTEEGKKLSVLENRYSEVFDRVVNLSEWKKSKLYQ